MATTILMAMGDLSDATPVGRATVLVGPYRAVVRDDDPNTGLASDRLP